MVIKETTELEGTFNERIAGVVASPALPPMTLIELTNTPFYKNLIHHIRSRKNPNFLCSERTEDITDNLTPYLGENVIEQLALGRMITLLSKKEWESLGGKWPIKYLPIPSEYIGKHFRFEESLSVKHLNQLVRSADNKFYSLGNVDQRDEWLRVVAPAAIQTVIATQKDHWIKPLSSFPVLKILNVFSSETDWFEENASLFAGAIFELGNHNPKLSYAFHQCLSTFPIPGSFDNENKRFSYTFLHTQVKHLIPQEL